MALEIEFSLNVVTVHVFWREKLICSAFRTVIVTFDRCICYLALTECGNKRFSRFTPVNRGDLIIGKSTY